MDTVKTYSTKANANRAAKKALETAPEGTTFEIGGEDKAYTFKLVMKSDEAPTVVEAPVEAPELDVAMKAPDTISGPVVINTQTVVVVQEVAAQPEHPRPYAYLPEDDEGIVATIKGMAVNPDQTQFDNFMADTGIQISEIRGMGEETALAHFLKIVKEDRAGWDVDFGGKRAERVKKIAGGEVVSNDSRTHKSTVEKPTKLVWDIAESMPGAKRKEVLAAAEARGVAFYTARTQYQQWLTAKKASPTPASN